MLERNYDRKDISSYCLLDSFLKYLKDNRIKHADVNINSVVNFSRHMNDKIKKDVFKIFSNLILVFLLSLSFYIIMISIYPNLWSYSSGIIPFIITFFSLLLQNVEGYKIHSFYDSFHSNKVDREQSFLFNYYKKYNNEKFINLEFINNSINNKNQRISSKNEKQNIQKLILDNELLAEDINDNNKRFLLDTENNKYGIFYYIDSLSNRKISHNEKKILNIIFNEALNDDFKKEAIFLNLWKLLQKCTSSFLFISQWLNSNKDHINDLIDSTINKNNIVILLSDLAEYKFKNKGSTDKIILNRMNIYMRVYNTIIENLNFESHFEICLQLNNKAIRVID